MLPTVAAVQRHLKQMLTKRCAADGVKFAMALLWVAHLFFLTQHLQQPPRNSSAADPGGLAQLREAMWCFEAPRLAALAARNSYYWRLV